MNDGDGCVMCVTAGSATAISGPKGQWIRAVIHGCLVQNVCMGEDAVKEAGKQHCAADHWFAMVGIIMRAQSWWFLVMPGGMKRDHCVGLSMSDIADYK